MFKEDETHCGDTWCAWCRIKRDFSSASGFTCVDIVGPTAGLRAAAGRRRAARVEDVVHGTLHLTVVDGLTFVGAERRRW